MSRGTTLVELMISVAFIGIMAGAAGTATSLARLAGLAELQRERAAQLLEYEADCVSTGREPARDVVALLSEALPRSSVRVVPQGALATIIVEWRAPDGRLASRVLTVFQGARR